MEMEKELKLNVTTQDGKIIILHGNAPKEILPVNVKIDGDIKTFAAFITSRKVNGFSTQFVDPTKAIVIVDKNDLTITLEVDPENVYGAKVVSTLELADELTEFYINKDKIFTKDALVKLLKFNRLFFPDKEAHGKLIEQLRKSNSTVNIAAGDSSDERGNKEREFKKTVETNIPASFMLNIPIFKGFSPVPFSVEICLDVENGNLKIWLESVELAEKIQVLTDEIFAEQLKAAEGFFVIYK